jgi:Fe-S-cluster containining protein
MDPYDCAFADLGSLTGPSHVYPLLDRLTTTVDAVAPCMHCVKGCSDCCNQQVLAGYAEWEILHAWILEHLDESAQRSVVRRAEEMLHDDSTSLPIWMTLSDHDDSGETYLNAINRALENQTTPCPFLVDGRCSVYAARPSICRAYGRMMRTGDSAYYCGNILEQMAVADSMDADLELPVFQGYHRAVLDGGNGELDEVNILPVWVLAHRAEDGTLRTPTHRIGPTSGFPVIDGYWAFDDGNE